MKRLTAFAALVAVVWALYHDLAVEMTPRFDAALLGFIALICWESCAVMIAFTIKWRLLALGLLSFFTATALLYTRVSSAGFEHPILSGTEVLHLIRALYLVAALLVAVGLNRWAWRHRRESFPMLRDADKPEPPVIFFEQERHDLP